jgi:uncharacterized protein (DUF488 family)
MHPLIYSIGHSSLSIDQFFHVLQHYQIEAIADVRRFPGSQKYPHFERMRLAEHLQHANISYFWLGEKLGGFRKEGYHAYAKTDQFFSGLQQLINIASQQVTAFMCAEKSFINCHRRFIADQLLSQKWNVIHIVDENLTDPHFSTDSISLDFSK